MPGRSVAPSTARGEVTARRARAGRPGPVPADGRRHHGGPATQPGVQRGDLGLRGALLRPVHLGRAVRAGQRVVYVGREDNVGRYSARCKPVRPSAATSRRPARSGATGSPLVSSSRAPNAWSRPAPPSVLALPPTPRTRLRAPASSAARSTSPAPKLGRGERRGPPARPPGAGRTRRPVCRPPRPRRAGRSWSRTGSPAGPGAVTGTRSNPAATAASTVPSPPSATGIVYYLRRRGRPATASEAGGVAAATSWRAAIP